MKWTLALSWCWLLGCSVLNPVWADYIVRSAAMKAPTIAQYYIDSDGVKLELDIDPADLPAFADLLPDQLRAKMQLEALPLEQRLQRFWSEGLPVRDQHGEALIGRVVSMQPQDRIERDPITGEPLPSAEDEPAPRILRVQIEYPFTDSRPSSLVFGGGRMTPRPTIGFVVYHRSVAVNEFRYLAAPAELQLDWQDPWYSRFTSRSMQRTYASAMNGFIYVEPYEVRKEIIVRPKDMQRWVDLGLDGVEQITPQMYPVIKQRLADFLAQHLATTIDGEAAVGELLGVNFLERKLTSSRVIDPPEVLELDSAVVGAIWVYPTLGLPQRVDVQWDLFDERIQKVSAATVDQAGPLPVLLEPDFSTLTWQNFLQQPHQPALVELAPPPGLAQQLAGFGRWLLLALLPLSLWWVWRVYRAGQPVAWPLALSTLVLLAMAGLFVLAAQRPMNQSVAQSLVADLLHNIYRAFDFRRDEQIYDVLAQSVSGDLLTRIYLETKQGLVLQNQGGARAKVQDVQLQALDIISYRGGKLVADVDWQVNAAVGHWGHVHQRVNRYQAQLTLGAEQQHWKLQAIDMLGEERLQ